MVESITPVVHGRRTRYLGAIALHALAATATAAATGAVLGLVGKILAAPWGQATAIAVIAVAVMYSLREAFRLPIPLPNARRQVPEWWRSFFSPPIAALLYGAGLGVAFVTFLSYGTFVAVAVGALASGDPVLGAILCAPFGLARAIAVAAATSAVAEPASAVATLTEIAATSLVRLINATTLALVAVVALSQLL